LSLTSFNQNALAYPLTVNASTNCNIAA
jgi:hypothetical protein